MEYIAYCGLKCHECPIYKDNIGDNQELKEKLAKEYSTDYCSFTPEDMSCEGCHCPSVKDSKMCGDCKVRNCATKQTISTCAECANYPCDTIEKYVPSGSDSRNLLNELVKSR